MVSATGSTEPAKKRSQFQSTKVKQVQEVITHGQLSGCPMCLTGIRENMEMKLEKCEWVNEQQLVEVGGYYTLLQSQQLKPRGKLESW